MKRLIFDRNNDKSYEVRIYNTGDEHDWIKYGDLRLNDDGNWELWTGTSHSSVDSGLKNTSDSCVEYSGDLDETFDVMEQELLDVFQDYNDEKFDTFEQLLEDFKN